MTFEEFMELKENTILEHKDGDSFELKFGFDEKYKIGAQSGEYSYLVNIKTKQEIILSWANKYIINFLVAKH